MDYTIPISPEVFALIAKILVGAQAIKKLLESSLFRFLITKITGGAEISGLVSVAISALVGLAFGIQQYGADGLSMSEIVDIISAIFGANGAFALGKAWMQPKPKEPSR